jgi:hypothetical protein
MHKASQHFIGLQGRTQDGPDPTSGRDGRVVGFEEGRFGPFNVVDFDGHLEHVFSFSNGIRGIGVRLVAEDGETELKL